MGIGISSSYRNIDELFKQDEDGFTALQHAARDGDTTWAKELIQQGADINFSNFRGSVLRIAVENNHADMVKLLLGYLVMVNASDDAWQETALTIASEKGFDEIVRLLLASGADINHRNEYQLTALDLASKYSHIETVRVIMEYGAKNKKFDITNALCFAAKNGLLLQLELLLTQSVKLPEGVRQDANPLWCAAAHGQIDAIHMLLATGAYTKLDGPIISAAQNRHLEALLLLSENLLLSDNLPEYYSVMTYALIMAVRNQDTRMINALLDMNIPVNLLVPGDTTALIEAAGNGNIVLTQLVLDLGVSINDVNAQGFTALMAAVLKNRLEMVKYLLEKGADCNLVTTASVTALMIASHNGNLKIIRELLSAHAKIHIQTSEASKAHVNGVCFGCDEHMTALMLAVSKNHMDVVSFLLKNGADIHYGSTKQCWIISSIKEGHEDMAIALIHHGADVHRVECCGHTEHAALTYAAQKGQYKVVESLIRAGANVEIAIASNSIEDTQMIEFIKETSSTVYVRPMLK